MYALLFSSLPKQKSSLDNFREQSGITLVWRQWVLDSFLESDISPEFIQHINDDFATIRESGFSAIVRFMYTSDYVSLAFIVFSFESSLTL